LNWLEELRKEIPVVSRKVYLDNAGAGPLTTNVIAEINGFLELWRLEGEPWELALERILESKREFCNFIRCSSDEEIAALPGATYAYNSFLSSMKFSQKDNIVLSELNFPTSFFSPHTLRMREIVKDVRIAKSRNGRVLIEEYEKLIDDNTRLVIVDYVSWLTGYKEDIRTLSNIAHEHGALLVTDAFHAVGVIPINVVKEGIDVLFTGSYKWLMGPHGAAFIYVKKDLLDELEPMFSGWMGIEDNVIRRLLERERLFERPFNIYEYRKPRNAEQLEWGTWPILSFIGTLSSMRFLRKYESTEKYSSHTSKLVERLIDGLSILGYKVITPEDSYAAIVSFETKNSYTIAEFLRDHKITVSPRPGLIRISPHFYNTMEEINYFLEKLSLFIKAK